MWWPLLISLASSSSNRACYDIVCHFDGSLRHPFDPGFPFAPGQWASCATVVQSRNHTAIGGKRLNASSTTTSSQIEYEGLLLALSEIQSHLQRDRFSGSDTTVLIRGDCKTTIEQMQGRSRPRRLARYHDQARTLAGDLDIVYEHCPRSENVECDRLCACIIQMQQEDLIQRLQDSIQTVCREDKSDTSLELKDFVDKVIDPQTSKVPFSLRPSLYRCLCQMVWQAKDYDTMMLLSQAFQQEVETVWKKADSTRVKALLEDLGRACREELLVVSLTYQRLALETLGRDKEASIQKQKNKYVLNKHVQVVSEIETHLSNDVQLGDSIVQFLDSSSKLVKQSEPQWPADVFQWRQTAMQSKHWEKNGVVWMQPARNM